MGRIEQMVEEYRQVIERQLQLIDWCAVEIGENLAVNRTGG
ncbi:hypothetical protein [Nostoc sp. CHAB 5715]|nr:hypothetical protein [Nostoc sp. CHAB 5715]